jgi:hypothetical protein
LEPEEATEHVERWNLFENREIDTTEITLDQTISALIARIRDES